MYEPGPGPSTHTLPLPAVGAIVTVLPLITEPATMQSLPPPPLRVCVLLRVPRMRLAAAVPLSGFAEPEMMVVGLTPLAAQIAYCSAAALIVVVDMPTLEAATVLPAVKAKFALSATAVTTTPQRRAVRASFMPQLSHTPVGGPLGRHRKRE